MIFLNDTATTEIYTRSLHDALPIWAARRDAQPVGARRRMGRTPPDSRRGPAHAASRPHRSPGGCRGRDRKSTRLNSSHANISYAVFCLKKKHTHLHSIHAPISSAFF